MQQPKQAPQPKSSPSPFNLASAPSGPAMNQNGLIDPASGLVDDEWRRWIAENLLLDLSRESIIASMVDEGITLEEANREVDLATQSPYLKGANLLRHRLKKRDWQLSNYRKLNRLHRASGTIERRHKLSRGEFLDQYYSTNRPVIITGMMNDWPAMRKWNLDYFSQCFGDREIEIQFGRSAGENYEIEREKYTRKLKMADFVQMVRNAENTNDFYLTANNNSSNKNALPELWDDIVQISEYLSVQSNQSQERLSGFFWMGPAGTLTPFHHDLTNNFMAQVIGRKRVKLAPSWDISLMSNHFHCYSKRDGRLMSPTPAAAFDEPQIHECILEPGEILFLPVGCMHFVEGIDISVTVSFTNFVFDNDFSSYYTTYHAV
ncbi:cupin-like domain-containing protein [Singulisphaera acidiphila]|uniref:Cupin superfamily protein n=1 Tax=Singulisphaera acidiphila (strain ATCC BAA-1392 / DSM 18658 / VKM B-2454 / MOB10) TaxID=886293 RepID=L0D867_SINAD|nr:Cupin superfamily protein [Singulisphaera acidiphila DSM 18658]